MFGVCEKLPTIRPARWVLALGLLWALVALISVWPPTWWYHLRSVQIADAPDAHSVLVVANRVIHSDHLGAYSVEMRRATDNSLVCRAPRQPIPFWYRESDAVVTFTLAAWMDDTADVERCVRNGLRDGRFYMVTCHTVPGPWILPDKTGCTRSNIFRLGDPRD